MACPRPPSSCLPGWRAGGLQQAAPPKVTGLGVLLSLLASQALRAPPTCAFLWPGNLGMDRLGAILLERGDILEEGLSTRAQGTLSGGTARNEMPASQMKTRSGSYQRV